MFCQDLLACQHELSLRHKLGTCFTQSASSLHYTCPCHPSLHLLITHPNWHHTNPSLQLCAELSFSQENSIHQPDHPHLRPFQCWIMFCPRGPHLAPIQQSASNAIHVILALNLHRECLVRQEWCHQYVAQIVETIDNVITLSIHYRVFFCHLCLWSLSPILLPYKCYIVSSIGDLKAYQTRVINGYQERETWYNTLNNNISN